MKQLRGGVALVTGSSGGIGTHIARRLAREGMDVAISGRREEALRSLQSEIAALGVRCEAVPVDLSERSSLPGLLERTEAALGPIDVLVNNAGIETIGAFTACPPEELSESIEVNLVAPMLLTRLALPSMLRRGRGHVVFMSSVAGKIGPAYNEPYAASKAGLIALTQSLRAEYMDAPVGFSVVCPGFTAGDGMYQRMVEEGHTSNRLTGETSVEKVTEAVLRAIVEDLPEVVESGGPIRPILAFTQLAPGLSERIASRSGVTKIFGDLAAARGRS
ncbi:MAG TPA: SDR family NAD(P)-dependent oxidoreductase [Solirubrobacteraceae bacterium]|jgi:short-subunit dehydrogenase